MRTTSESSSPDRRSGGERRQPGRRAAETLHLVVERMADGVLVVDRDGRICFANPAAAALFGRDVHALLDEPFGFSVLPGDSTEMTIVRPGGQATVELRAVEYEWQEHPALLVSLRDVTDRKCLEQERLARARAEAASRAKSEFLMLMSHELRTPLNAVIGYADLLLVDGAPSLTAEQRSRVVRIHASGRHLRDLVDEMLDLAEAGEGRLTVSHASAPAVRPANKALEEARATAEVQGVHLVTTCVGDEQLAFTGDEVRVRQVLALLLDNAIKFTPRGGTVQLECEEVSSPPPGSPLSTDGRWVRWRVVDTGIGIAEEQLASIFEPFVQVDGGHTREKEGSGLGLTIGRSLARLMKGDLTVESQQARGSTFTLWLPAA